MTKEQQEACEALADKRFDRDDRGDGGSCHYGFSVGFKAAQSPEMLMLNPLVKGLVEAIDEKHALLEKYDNLCLILKSIFENGDLVIETWNEAVMYNFMEILGYGFAYKGTYRDISKDFQQYTEEELFKKWTQHKALAPFKEVVEWTENI